MKTQQIIKINLGVLVIIGVVLGYFERKYAPDVIEVVSPHHYPSWLSALGWWISSLAAIGYVLIDVIDSLSKKRRKKE